MLRKLLSLTLSLIIFATLIPSGAKALVPDLVVDPTVIKNGGKVNITATKLFTGNPNTFYYANITYLDGTLIDQLEISQGCVPQQSSSNIWSETSCSEDTFKTTLNSSEIINTTLWEIDKNDFDFTITIVSPDNGSSSKNIKITAQNPPPPNSIFKIDSISPKAAKAGDNITINLSNITVSGGYDWQLLPGIFGQQECTGGSATKPTKCAIKFKFPEGIDSQTISIIIRDPNGNTRNVSLDVKNPNVCLTCPKDSFYDAKSLSCQAPGVGGASKTVEPLSKAKCGDSQRCNQGKGCETTFTAPPNSYANANTPTPICTQDQVKNKNCQIQTGLGVKINFTGGPGEFIKTLMGILFGIIGGIATILIIFSGYRLMVSQGNPEKIQGAKDQLTAAIIGLLFTIFSLVILQTIGYDILRLPGFGK